MDFQKIVDGIGAMACIVSVEKLENDRYGKFRIVTGNRSYISTIEKPGPGTKMLTDKFIPNAEYTTYLTRDLNFEDFCYRAAVKKQCLHSYAHPDRMPVWFNMTFLPIDYEEGNLCHCIYIMEINVEADSKRLSNISGEMASAVLETCIKLRGTTDFKNTMKSVVKDIRELCDAEHCCILTMNTYEKSCAVLCEAFSETSKLKPMDTYLNEHFYSLVESWEDTIAGSNCLIAKNDQDMEVVQQRNPGWYESLLIAGAKNIVLFPLKSRDHLLGYMWVINFNADNAVKIKETLELTTFILGSELANYLLLDRLKILSSKDMLTGVLNRNEMNNFVDKLSAPPEKAEEEISDSSVGVIFADLNGLKTVNDEEGHPAGDKLLKDAAKVLLEVFDDSQIFRAGGDEFSIIITGITENELNKKIEQIRKVSENYGKVNFALGGSVEPSRKNVRLALRHADENMYEDKKKYYAAHPEKKVR
ncbi:sensor domain-containing diguanylate cyclase [Treponema sp.]|uniref:sensor domain-containing diguanylate cyclase n=1 Tax=Treponema sp. TaxID=166 RepID=UPI00298EC5AE|nr:sensor domain-containing diguanylate cyclase [Treponema sp.]MCR5614270.1 sensor domain-containing diguanylate cyclase [Treponema sp.]